MTIRKSAVSGVRWTAISSVCISVLQYMQVIVLARLLVPQDFGIMAMIMVVLGFAQAYADMGISKAIIHRQDTTRLQLSSLYWLNIAAGILVTGMILAISPLVAQFYGEPRLEEFMPITALVFLITPVGQQFQTLLQKELRFRVLSFIEAGSTALGVIVAVSTAFAGAGVYALIWGQLSTALAKSVFLAGIGWREWRPAFRFNRGDLKGYIGFGLYQMGDSSVNYFNSQVDKLLIGRLLGSEVLGYYQLAWNLIIQPISKINPILTQVAFPIFAKIQLDNERLKRGYILLLRLLSFINFPLLIGMAAVAPLLVPLVFGERWLPSVPLVQVLALVAVSRAKGNPLGSLQLAKGRADMAFKWNAMLLLTQLPGVYLGARWGGAVGVAIALLILQALYSLFGYSFLLRNLLGPCLKEYLMSMLPALGCSALMAVTVSFIPQLMKAHSWPILIIQVLSGGLLYLALNLAFQRRQMQEMKSLVIGR